MNLSMALNYDILSPVIMRDMIIQNKLKSVIIISTIMTSIANSLHVEYDCQQKCISVCNRYNGLLLYDAELIPCYDYSFLRFIMN